MFKAIQNSLIVLLVFSIITGLIYPLAMVYINSYIFPFEAYGSLIVRDEKFIGSALIGQNFTSDKYLWSRPSSTSQYPYNALMSGGSNQGPSNIILIDNVNKRAQFYTQYLQDNALEKIPVDFVTSSGSGLDPEISMEAALFQAPRIAKARNIPKETVENLMKKVAHMPVLFIFSEYTVNVLYFNLALDKIKFRQYGKMANFSYFEE